MIKDAFIYFLSKLLPALISFGILFLYLNYLDPAEYGLYSLIIVSVGLTNILLNQWVRSSYLRFKYRFENSDDLFFTKQFLLLIFSNIILFIVLFLVQLNWIIAITFVILFNLLVVNEFLSNYYRILLKPIIILKGSLIKNLIFISSLLVSVYIVEIINVYVALFSYGFGLLISSIYYLIISKFNISFRFDKEYLLLSLKYGLPITLSFSLGVFLQNIDKYMITYILGIEDNGNYSIGFDFIHNFFFMTMSSLATASLPRILKNTQCFSNMIVQFKDYSRLFIYITLPFLITLLTISEEISEIFFAFDYSLGQSLICFIIVATFAHGIKTYIYDQAIQLYEKTTLIFIPIIVAIIINVVINILFLEKYGVIIASVSTFFAFIISAFLSYLMIRKEIKITFDYIYILIASFLGIITFYTLDIIELNSIYINLFIKTLISMTGLSLLSLAFICIRKENRNENRQ